MGKVLSGEWTSTFYVTLEEIDLYTAEGVFYANAPKVRFECEAFAFSADWRCTDATVMGKDERGRETFAVDLKATALEHVLNNLTDYDRETIGDHCARCLADAPAHYQAA